MISAIDWAARHLLGFLDPERAHAVTIKALTHFPPPLPRAGVDDARLRVGAFGLSFPNPLGMAAGFDKNADVPHRLLRLGFGFVEIGTVTPRAQPGNPRPRLFRLHGDDGVINRLGFNSAGAASVRTRLAVRDASGGIVGVNIGANRDAVDRVGEYAQLIETLAPVAGYFAVNVSSPNTPGLRELQHAHALDDLLARVIDARDRAAARSGRRPLLLKIAPDLNLPELDDVVTIARRRCIDGMIVANTTIRRPANLHDIVQAREAGGLSGRPLFALATRILAETYARVDGAFPLIGVGGIDSGETALAKLRAGASLIQLYSALVFRGFGLVANIKSAMLAALASSSATSLAAFVGADAAALTRQPWPD